LVAALTSVNAVSVVGASCVPLPAAKDLPPNTKNDTAKKAVKARAIVLIFIFFYFFVKDALLGIYA
jgi:hypothetical protein